MKTKGLFIALSLVIFTSLNLLANAAVKQSINDSDSTQQRINIRVNQNNQVVLRAEKNGKQKRLNLILEVYSESGSLVYASSINKKERIYLAFDLAKLPKGKYTFEVHNNLNKIYEKTIFKGSEYVSTDGSSDEMIVQER